MAKVYKAFDLRMEREVAVKLINQELRSDPEFDARFQREARIASQLNDPHIVVVHDYGIDPAYGPFLVMEYLRGETLRERLATGGPLPYKAGLQLGAQMLLALIHAHDQGIVHRDIKPDNVFLLNQSGIRLHLRILDFGIARIFRRDDPGYSETLTSVGAVLGTPRYMSPEQLAGQPVDARSDLYSAALVIHEGLTGQLPFLSGKSLCELCPEATPNLQELLLQCLKPNPAERPATALEVYLRLQELGRASGILLLPPGALEKLAGMRKGSGEITLHAEPTQAATAAAPPAAGRTPYLLTRGPRRLLLALAACLLLVGAAFLVKAFFFPDQPPTPPPPPPGPEALLDVRVGEPKADVVEKLDLVRTPKQRPGEKDAEYLGHALTFKRGEMLPLTEDEQKKLQARTTRDEKICGLFVDEKVVAVVLQHPHEGKTARGVGVGSRAAEIEQRYGGENSTTRFVRLAGGSAKLQLEVRQFDGLGVAFTLQEGKVIEVTLYPATPPEQ
jgi:serine/threonine-protein kinase